MIRVLFLCHGNICRSPMAEFVMKDMLREAGLENEVHVESAALRRDVIGHDIHRGTRAILDKYCIPHTPRAARLATKQDYKEFDYLVGMDAFNYNDMLDLWKNDPKDKCSMLLEWAGEERDIDDPWYTDDFKTAFFDIDLGCEALLKHIAGQLGK